MKRLRGLMDHVKVRERADTKICSCFSFGRCHLLQEEEVESMVQFRSY